RWFWLQFVTSDEHQLMVTDEGAGSEAPPIGDAIVSHSPFHRAFEVRQRLGGQGIDMFGDALLRFGKAFDIDKYRLVAFGRFRGTRLAGHRYQKLGTFCPRRSGVLFYCHGPIDLIRDAASAGRFASILTGGSPGESLTSSSSSPVACMPSRTAKWPSSSLGSSVQPHQDAFGIARTDRNHVLLFTIIRIPLPKA